ncbi:MAG TPA: recombinase family protein, partial [Planctomycetota bacterium]
MSEHKPHHPQAVAYLRRSTDRQEQSIPDQQQAILKYAEQHGLEVSHFYVDDAVSGSTAEGRPAFLRMIADAQKPGQPWKTILVYDVKRFGRLDNDEAGYYRYLLRMHGVEVRYVVENFLGNDADDLLRAVKQWQAREESKDLSKVTIRGLLTKIAGGWWMGGVPPYGYDLRYTNQRGEFLFVIRYNPDRTKNVLNETGGVSRGLSKGENLNISKSDRARLVFSALDRVKVVRRIFRMYVAGTGYTGIAERLNDLGVPSPRAAEWSCLHDGTWSSSTIHEIIANPIYTGDMVWNRRTEGSFHQIRNGAALARSYLLRRKVIPNPNSDWILIRQAHPAIVSRPTFDEAHRQ